MKKIVGVLILGLSAIVMAAETQTVGIELVERVIGTRACDFRVEQISVDQGQDVYEIESVGSKIVLRGNNGVSVASALNAYLRDFCSAHVSWNCGDQLNIPDPLPTLSQKVRVVTPYMHRFAYNYCTHGYTMPWWEWKQWERELDFLAMQGINMAMIIQGQEQVWINTFKEFGYTDMEMRDWLCMPSHQPWQYMSNMEYYGGIVPKTIVDKRVKLGKEIFRRMRKLGMTPVMQGYYGIVPSDFHTRFPDANVHPQGLWGAGIQQRPDMLDPTDPMFAKVSEAFYESQKKLFGASDFYAADPFHEGGKTKGINVPACGQKIYEAMQTASSDSTWVIQSWGNSPRQALINALPKENLLILDLFCEAQENWRTRHEFGGTPWLWCTIHNFGGNNGISGKLHVLADAPPKAFQEAGPGKGYMKGIGALMEGSETNPMIWEMFFRNSWRTDAPDMQDWLKAYADRRYGANESSARKAVQIIAETSYHSTSKRGQYPHNSVVCGRPSLDPLQRARNWTGTTPHYDIFRLASAMPLLLAAAPDCKDSDAYLYDVADLGRQVLSDLGTRYHVAICSAWQQRDAEKVEMMSKKLLALIRGMDELVGSRKELLLGAWIRDARRWGSTPEEKDMCEWNARALLTTWCVPQTHLDYANRQWAGLLGDFYLHRWVMWTDALQEGIENGWKLNVNAVRKKIQTWEYSWTRQTDSFAATPTGDTVEIAQRLWKTFGEDALNPFLGLGEIMTTVTSEDFCGRWHYMAGGKKYMREISKDGSLKLYSEGNATSMWSGYTWIFKSPAIELRKPDGSIFGKHILKNNNTILFVGESWPPATRIATE